MDEFKKWLNSVCFQKPTPEAYDLAKDAWEAALISKKADGTEVPCNVGLCKKPSYLIIDKEYRIYKSPVLSGYVRSQVRRGDLSVISLSRLKGMNCLKLHSEGGLQGDYGENEWSDIQELPEGFKVDA